MSVLVVVPGFGSPHINAKADILRRNMATLAPLNPDFVIFCYEPDGPAAVPINLPLPAKWIYEPGIIGQFIKRHITPEYARARAYDYIILLLDDIELDAKIDYAKVLKFMDLTGLDMVSPTLASRDMSFWGEIMTPIPDSPNIIARIMPFIELFCYIFRADAYCEKYWPFVDADNPWMWGLDFILQSHMKIRAGLLNNVTMKHYFANSAYSKDLNDPRRDSERYLERHGTSWAAIHADPKNKMPRELIMTRSMFNA